MPEINFKLRGWQAVAVIIIVVCLIVYRFISFKDLTSEAALVREIETHIASEYMPAAAEKLKAAQASGDAQELERLATSLAATELSIEGVTASSPLLDFSSPRDVVVKVTYAFGDGSSDSDTQTRYFLFEKSLMPNSWRYRHESNVVSYYLNFL
jgi:hypothetical protein